MPSVEIVRIDSRAVENEGLDVLRGVARRSWSRPGFGARGVKGKLRAIQYARERKIPFLGICYGMQLACVEFARNVCGLPDAMTSEVDETSADPVIDFMPDQRNLEMSRAARCGWARTPARSKQGRSPPRAYGELEISERHRHRYEFNNRYGRSSKSTACVSAGTIRSAGRRWSR